MRRSIPSASGAAFKKPESATAAARAGRLQSTADAWKSAEFRLPPGFCRVTTGIGWRTQLLSLPLGGEP